MALCDESLAYVRAIAPYQPGKPVTQLAREYGIPVEQIVKLASNENPLGMSPKAKLAVEAAISGVERYPDDFELKAALATRNKVVSSQIVLGNGSNDVLDLVARVYLCQGRSAVFSQHAFAVYPLASMSVGADLIQVPAKEYGHDLPAMLAAVRADTKVIWIANPNNPTGTFIPYPELHAFMKAVPSHVVVVIDEAYNEYLAPKDRGDIAEWLPEFPNLVVTRTFSKIFGLAGLRIGYALTSSEIADLMNRVRQPFNCNNLALAGAIAALDDVDFVARSYLVNCEGLKQITAGLQLLGLSYIEPHGNFVTFKVGAAAAVNEKLLSMGVIVRPIGGYGMPEWLRVTVGTEQENARFLAALKEAIATL